jgi:hypothetical protein
VKFRINFVSNSSSASFIIVGDRINWNDITDEMILKEKIYGQGLDWSDEDDGLDLFPITKKMMYLYKNYFPKIRFWKIDKLIKEGGTFSKNEIEGETITIMQMSVSLHTTKDIKTFKERYIHFEN